MADPTCQPTAEAVGKRSPPTPLKPRQGRNKNYPLRRLLLLPRRLGRVVFEFGDAVAEGDWLGEAVAGWVCTWGEYLHDREEAELAAAMRQRENTGRPLGDKPFVERIGQLLTRDLLPKKPGPRPNKKR